MESGSAAVARKRTIGQGLEAAGIVLGAIMLGFLALQPTLGWLACVGIGVAVLLVQVERRSLGLRPALLAPLILLALMPLLSLAVTPLRSVTLEKAWLLWGSLGAFYLVALWARTRQRLIWAGAALAALGAGFSLAAPFVVDWFISRKTFFPSAVYGLFPQIVADTIHPNVMASLMAGLIFIAVAWAAKPPVVRGGPRWLRSFVMRRWVWATAAFLMALVLFLTKSRGAYAAAGIGAIVLLLLMIPPRRRAAWILAVVALAVLGLAFWGLGFTPWSQVLPAEALNLDSLAFRGHVWQYAVMLISDFPYTGVGMGAFNEVATAMYGYVSYGQPGAHSLFLQAALDVGIPGAVAFIAILGGVLAGSLRAFAALKSRGDEVLWPLVAGGVAGLSATVAQGFIDIAAWGTRGSFVLWVLLGLLAAVAECAHQVPRDDSRDS